MSGQLRVDLLSHGSESQGTPVRVEVMDTGMRRLAERWARTPGHVSLDLEPATYGVRVSVGSGRHMDRVATVAEGEATDLPIPLYELSPHEGHEWAYFAHKVHASTELTLAHRPFEGAWLRVWEKWDGGWRPIAVSEGAAQRLTEGADGITYSFDPPGNRPYLLQTGGEHIPWRFTALPPSHRLMVMIKPSGERADYPLDVAVSSENRGVQTLLTLLQLGEISAARTWDREAGIAERMLYGKVRDPAAAAVGGYFLLRIRDFGRLHHWANNLANWIDWMADGPIIHAWQLFVQADAEPASREQLTAHARERLLEAVTRGVPLYTEGLRLLRDGLLGLHRAARGKDDEVAAALSTAGEYVAAFDPSLPTTTFLAEVPERPVEASRTGIPDDGEPMMFVFGVPLRELLRERLIVGGEHLKLNIGDGLEVVVEEEGGLRLPDGRSFESIADLEDQVGGEALSPRQWEVRSLRKSLFDAGDLLRRSTFSRAPRGRARGAEEG